MNVEHRFAGDSFSTTPPKHSLPPTPPGTGERKRSLVICSVQDLRRFQANQKGSEAKEITRIRIGKEFDPHQHLEEIHRFLRRFDCYPTYIRVRMPSIVHELVIKAIEREFITKQIMLGGRCSDIELYGSSRVFLGNGRESRDPDIQFQYGLERYPRVIIEVAKTQSLRELDILAHDYILKSGGAIKSVFGINLNPLGKPSTVSQWSAKITPSDDPAYEEEVRVEKTLFKDFRAADGKLANPDESILIPFSDSSVDVERRHQGILIPFSSIFKAYIESQKKESHRQKELEDHRQKELEDQPPAKRLKLVERVPTPVEELNSEDEVKFRRAEEVAEEIDSDFEPSNGDDSSQQSRTK